MENSKLQKMLKAHKLWIDSNKKQGEPADLCEANLHRADLREANLREADLREADLCGANLDFLVRSSLLLWRNTNYRRP